MNIGGLFEYWLIQFTCLIFLFATPALLHEHGENFKPLQNFIQTNKLEKCSAKEEENVGRCLSVINNNK